MLDLSNLTRAPEWRVTMERKRGMNANQNQRERTAYVIARDEADAKAQAARKYPEFVSMTARKV